MKIIKLLICLSILLPVLNSGVQAQTLSCSDIIARYLSPIDIMRVKVPFSGKPGDTVLCPISMKNDSLVTGFLMLMQYDSTKLHPVEDPANPGSIEYVILSNRFLITDTTSGTSGDVIDTLTALSAQFLFDRRDVIQCLFTPRVNNNPVPPDTQAFFIDTVKAGNDVLYGLKFVVDPGMPIGDSALFSFFNRTTWIPDPNGIDSIPIECRMTNESQAWVDNTGTHRSATVYPQTPISYFKAVQFTPPFVTLAASKDTVSQGNSVVLSWTMTNADSVYVKNSSNVIVGGGKTATGLITVSNMQATTTFTATANGPGGTATASVKVTVITGGGTGTAPTIAISTYPSSIDAQTSVSFTVSATDPDAGDIITLSAASASMPSGASFGNASFQVVGSTGLNGTFSWTPTSSQVGTFQIEFDAQDVNGNQATPRIATITVTAPKYDRLFSSSAPSLKPVGGLRGKKGIMFPVNLVSTKTVYGVQFDMAYPRNIVKLDSLVKTGRIPEYVVYDNIGETPGNIRVVTFGLNNESVKDVNDTTAILYVALSLDSSATPWTTATMMLTNGRESVDPNPNVGSLPLVTDSGIVEIDNPGDVNLDKYIDVADVVNIVANIIGSYDLTPRQFDVADLITDLSVDVFDLVGDVNLIYGKSVSPAPPPPTTEPATVALAYGSLTSGSSDVMKVTSELPEQVAGVQLEIRYDPNSVGLGIPEKTADNRNFMLQYRDDKRGKMIVVLYHMAPFKTNELIQQGTADLVDIPIVAKSNIIAGNKNQIRLTEALLSTPSAAAISVRGTDPILPQSFELKQNYPNPFNPTTTIEFSIAADNGQAGARQVNLEIFNVLGQRVKTLVDGPMQPGEYHMEWDATTNTGQRVATGIYLYRLRVGSESLTRKMLFLK